VAKADKRNAAIYVRISRDKEGRALGVDRQEKACRSLAKRLGWTVVTFLSDNDISASTHSKKRRPSYEAMLKAIDAGEITGVLAYSTSRLTRRPLELEGLIQRAEKGLAINTVAAGEVDLSTANGRAMARTLAAFDAREAEENSERSRIERAQRRDRGRWNGGLRPFGWEKDGMTPRPAERALIEQAAKDVLAGRSLAAIARDWTHVLGGSAMGRSKVRAGAVRDVLMNPRVAGLMPDGQRRATWPAFLSENTWRAVSATLADPARKSARGENRLLTGIAFCGLCGATVHGGVTRDGLPTYRCSALKHLDRRAEAVDAFVTEILVHWLARERLTVPAGDNTSLAEEAQGLRARLDQTADLFAAGDITSEQLARITATLRAALEDVEGRMVTNMGAAAMAGLPLEEDALRAAWEGLDVTARRQVLRGSGMQVIIHPPGRGVREFDPATVAVEWRTS
jgi:DNA invertase Pin-like site-specific DNA recombinase